MKNGVSLRIIVLIVAAALGFTQASAQGKPDNALVKKLKTLMIYNFSRSIIWPQEDNLREFRICVLNSDRIAEQLGELEDAKFRKRIPIRVVLCRSVDELTNCQMVVVDGGSKDNLWAVYSRIRYKPILMVAENLEDYKRSMVSFVIIGKNLKYIVNKTKFDESPLRARDEFTANAITREEEWKSIFDKFQSLLQSKGPVVSVEKEDLRTMISEYRNLEEEKKAKEVTIERMVDSLRNYMGMISQKADEYKRISAETEKQRLILAGLSRQMDKARQEIRLRESEITRQKTVIGIIAGLTFIVLVLLAFAIRINSQRRKANLQLSVQKSEVERQKMLVESKQQEILDSIAYAKRIQNALMASDTLLSANLPDYFVFFRPKDIVAGDFYWAEVVGNSFMYATADSTGHGVPGAFMSLLNISKLNEAVNQKHITRPDLVLNDVKKEIIQALNPEGTVEESKDGMDVVLCNLDTTKLVLQYAAANASFCIVRGLELLECKADKMPVGKSHNEHLPFTLNEIALQKGDMIYTFTDGIADQFGGPHGKKLKFKYLKNILTKISALPLERQKEILVNYYEDWKGELEQVDDILVIGVRV